jgi:threonine dehydratase
MLGYTHIFDECAQQWDAPPEIVLVQAGVGGLLAAAASYLAWRDGADRPFLIGCEPESHACLLESVRSGRPIELMTHVPDRAGSDQGPSAEGAREGPDQGPRDQRPGTVMAGLRCTRPSASAWPAVASGVDAFIAVPDSLALETIDRLRLDSESGHLHAGPSGICSLAALLALGRDERAERLRRACGLSRATRAMVIVTEGP